MAPRKKDGTYQSGAATRKAPAATAPHKASTGLTRVRAKDQHGLLPLHRSLLEAYLGEADFNLLRACDIVGLHPSQPKHKRLKQAERILARPEVRALMQQFYESDPLVMSRQERLRRLTRIGRGEKVSVFIDDDGMEVSRPASMGEQLKALELLGKAQGDAVNVNVQINPEQMSEDELLAAMLALGVDPAQLGDGTIDTEGEDVSDGEDEPTREDDDLDTLASDADETLALPDERSDPEPQ